MCVWKCGEKLPELFESWNDEIGSNSVAEQKWIKNTPPVMKCGRFVRNFVTPLFPHLRKTPVIPVLIGVLTTKTSSVYVHLCLLLVLLCETLLGKEKSSVYWVSTFTFSFSIDSFPCEGIVLQLYFRRVNGWRDTQNINLYLQFQTNEQYHTSDINWSWSEHLNPVRSNISKREGLGESSQVIHSHFCSSNSPLLAALFEWLGYSAHCTY